MSRAMIIFSLIAGWMAVAAAMLWGVLRIARRHQHHEPQVRQQVKPKAAVTLRRTSTPQHI